MYKEEKICSYTAPKKRIQLLKITEEKEDLNLYDPWNDLTPTRYHVRDNRKIIINTISEAQARKKFTSLIAKEVLQQKFTF